MEKLSPEQLAMLLKSLQGQAMMSSEEMVEEGVGSDYRKGMLENLKRLKSQSPESLKQAGEIIYPSNSEAVKKGANVVPFPGKKVAQKVAAEAGGEIGERAGLALAKKLGLAALGGVPGMLVSGAAEAADAPEAGNPEEERMMLAERNAMEDYKSSPARLARLQALMQNGKNK